MSLKIQHRKAPHAARADKTAPVVERAPDAGSRADRPNRVSTDDPRPLSDTSAAGPSLPPPSAGRGSRGPYRCQHCHERGHNARGCPAAPKPTPPPIAEPPGLTLFPAADRLQIVVRRMIAALAARGWTEIRALSNGDRVIQRPIDPVIFGVTLIEELGSAHGGLAGMSPERRREITSLGGKAAAKNARKKKDPTP